MSAAAIERGMSRGFCPDVRQHQHPFPHPVFPPCVIDKVAQRTMKLFLSPSYFDLSDGYFDEAAPGQEIIVVVDLDDLWAVIFVPRRRRRGLQEHRQHHLLFSLWEETASIK